MLRFFFFFDVKYGMDQFAKNISKGRQYTTVVLHFACSFIAHWIVLNCSKTTTVTIQTSSKSVSK